MWPTVEAGDRCYQFVDLDNHPWNEIVRDPQYLAPAPAAEPQLPAWTPTHFGEKQPPGTRLVLPGVDGAQEGK